MSLLFATILKLQLPIDVCLELQAIWLNFDLQQILYGCYAVFSNLVTKTHTLFLFLQVQQQLFARYLLLVFSVNLIVISLIITGFLLSPTMIGCKCPQFVCYCFSFPFNSTPALNYIFAPTNCGVPHQLATSAQQISTTQITALLKTSGIVN